MGLEIGVIVFLSLVVVFLWWQKTVLLRRQKIQAQYEKIIQLLHAYPVHQYTMAHMLERCLAIIFSAPQLHLLPKGAIFLMQNEKLSLVAQRGMADDLINECSHTLVSDFLCGIDVETGRFQFISTKDLVHRQLCEEGFLHGHYVVPLIRNNALIGLLTLYTSANYKAAHEAVKFIKSVGITVSSLVERKLVADELRLGNCVMDLSQQAIFITDSNINIIRCNKACERLTGFSSKELIGQNPRILKSGHQSSGVYKELWQEVSEKGIWQGEIRNKSKDGREIVEWLTISTIKDADDKVVQYLAIFTDLTAVHKEEKDQLKYKLNEDGVA